MRTIDADYLKTEFEEDGHLSPYIEEYIDACPTVGEWISVKDGLPEKEQLVLFVPTYNQGIVYIGKVSHCGNNGGVMFDRRFTRHKTANYAKYWMPLPEPPKEESNETD